MNIKIEYIYIYRTVFVPPAGGVRPSAAQRQRAAAMSTLSGMAMAELDPEKAKKLKRLEMMVNAMLGKVHNIPAKGLQAALADKVEELMMLAQSGNVDGALASAEALSATIDQALRIGGRVTRAMAQLTSMMSGLPPAARDVVAGVLQAAEKALDNCATVDGLEAIAGMLEQAVDLVKELKTLDPKSPEYELCLGELGRVTAVLEAYGGDGSATPGMGHGAEPAKPAEDGLELSFKATADALKTLRLAERDSLKQARIASIESQMADAQAKARELPTEGMKQLVEQVSKQILLDTAAGKLDEAHEGASELAAFVDRMTRLDRHLNIKQARADRLASQLKGPAADTMANVMKHVAAAREQATSPDEMLAIDAALLEAAQLAEKIQQNPRSPEALKAHQALRALEKKLDGLVKQADAGDRLTASMDFTKGQQPAKTGPLHLTPSKGKRDVWSASDGYRQTRELSDMQELPRFTERDFERIAASVPQALHAQQAQQPQRVVIDGPLRLADAPQGPAAPQGQPSAQGRPAAPKGPKG